MGLRNRLEPVPGDTDGQRERKRRRARGSHLASIGHSQAPSG
jgi:hypothetical protein